MSVMFAINDHFGLTVDATRLAECGTIAELWQLIDAAAGGAAQAA